MKAAVCREFGAPLVIEDVELADPGPGEVTVRIEATAICHSDITYAEGGWGGELPALYGHEGAGIVTVVGPGVTSVHLGDKVVVTLIRSCGHCHGCVIGMPVTCETTFPLDLNSPLRDASGVPIVQGMRTGAFAEFVVVDASQLVAVPRDLPSDVASLLACGVITGFGAVTNTARARPGSHVVVFGCGGVGLNSVQAAQVTGAQTVIAIDLADNKLDAARRFGATHVLNPSTDDIVTAVRDLTGGRGADYVFVTVGNAKASEQAFAMLRMRGVQVIVGIPEAGATASFPVGAFVQERTVTGSMMGSTRLSVDVPRLFDLYRNKQLLLNELITRRLPLEQINDAIAHTQSGAAIRNVIMF